MAKQCDPWFWLISNAKNRAERGYWHRIEKQLNRMPTRRLNAVAVVAVAILGARAKFSSAKQETLSESHGEAHTDERP